MVCPAVPPYLGPTKCPTESQWRDLVTSRRFGCARHPFGQCCRPFGLLLCSHLLSGVFAGRHKGRTETRFLPRTFDSSFWGIVYKAEGFTRVYSLRSGVTVLGCVVSGWWNVWVEEVKSKYSRFRGFWSWFTVKVVWKGIRVSFSGFWRSTVGLGVYLLLLQV